ncbi:inositol polyphosphate-4-phosphatase type I A-like isoform X2 [Rhopilema esculentum]|uniref:inositol polyphosphate-4-phosphatase type I A-like isoform X2 n=1 Tax=Rhopilema esculentum TaxID=499914 RepID=UPI0031E21569
MSLREKFGDLKSKMPLRFNQKEVTSVATRCKGEFDKQGVLALREDDGKRFHKSERFVERLFRLKGNLLFYSSKDSFLEVSGVIVLDQCKLCLTTASKKFTFVIDSDLSEDRYELAADSEKDLDDWVKKIDNARYEVTSRRLLQLRIDIVKLSGEDPLPDYPSLDFQNPGYEAPSLPHILSLYQPPSLQDKSKTSLPKTEVCIACTNLSLLQDSLKPVLVVKVLTKISPGHTWSNYSETEFCEEFREPFFLKTMVFDQTFPSSTRLKFVLYDVRNRLKGVVVGLGQAICSLQDIHQAPGWRLTLSLIKLESKEDIGCIVLQGWKRNLGKSFDRRQNSIDFIKGYGQRDSSALIEYPRTYIGNVCEQSFHYPTKDDDDVKFQELMGESTIPFNITCQLLKIYINEEKEAVLELHKLGKLDRNWEQVKNQQQNDHFDLVSKFSESLADLASYKERNFKKSSEKGDKELEFVTTNLHVQRIRVIDRSEEFCYDVITFGSPSAHSLKFRHGGLKRLLDDDASPNESLSASENEIVLAATKALRIKNVLKGIQQETMQSLDEIESLDNEGLKEMANFLSNKVADVLNLASSSFVQEAEKQLAMARPKSKDSSSESQNDCGWEWNDGQYQMVKLDQVEHENNDCGLRDELAKFMSLINLLTNSAPTESSLKTASERLSLSISSFIRKICVIMRFILMKKFSSFSTCTKEVQYRRDVVFAQVLSPVIAGFTVKLSESLQNPVFLQQILKIGLLVNFESLITAYGEELGMLEDAVVAYKDLKKAKFKFMCDNSWNSFPSLEGDRQDLIVSIPLHEENFKKLPLELQNGYRVPIYPVVFNVGINEHATIAERFGDMSVQDSINAENMNYLFTYYEKFSSYFPEWIGTNSECQTSLAMLMVHLQVVVNSKKSKNVDIFCLCEEICQRMNGIRLTTCKSAKDRTAMAVTLEAARILQREHRLPQDLFLKTLNTMRCQGTRLVNSLKNVGIPKYAFNKMQVRAYPSLYRAPEGTYGKNVQN